MKIAITGSTGLIGRKLVQRLSADGHDVWTITRAPVQKNQKSIFWKPTEKQIQKESLEGLDAVVHLAGESIVGRWTPEKKRKILESREQGTLFLSETLASLTQPPKVLVSASAIGYYGERGDEVLTEESGPGTGFLADVCMRWEKATEPAKAKGIRVILARIGMVLAAEGGALKSMKLPFSLGLGGRLGDGKHYMSWIAIDDVVGGILRTFEIPSIAGPMNLVGPSPVRNFEFTKALGSALRRPTIFPMPVAVARLVFGEMADELLLGSTRVHPAKLLTYGYPFKYSNLLWAIQGNLKKN